jgi:hypothetical protein
MTGLGIDGQPVLPAIQLEKDIQEERSVLFLTYLDLMDDQARIVKQGSTSTKSPGVTSKLRQEQRKTCRHGQTMVRPASSPLVALVALVATNLSKDNVA